MIVQTAPENQPHFVIRQADHAQLSGQFAAAFSNAQFALLAPAEPMIFVAGYHDEGWQETDEMVLADPKTGLPYHLTQTPLAELFKTSVRSPEFNERHHPYSGLLSSMHTVGLFNGRYGLSDKIFINLVPAEYKLPLMALLKSEEARQERLKEQLRKEGGETAVYTQPDPLFHNYKLLQFFDTLALYFHMTHPAARATSHFLNVPRAVGDDVTITINPVAANVYALSPYPFSQPDMQFSYQGRYLSPQPAGTDLQAYMNSIEFSTETIILIQGD